MLILEEPTTHRIHTLAFSPDGNSLATIRGRAQTATIWDLNERKIARNVLGPGSRLASLAFSPSGEHLAVLGNNCELWLWGEKHLEQRFQFHRDASQVSPQIAFRPDGSEIFVLPHHVRRESRYRNYYNPALGIASVVQKKQREWVLSQYSEISCVTFSPDGRFVVLGDFKRTVQFYEAANLQLYVSVELGKKVHYIAFSPDGATFAAGSPSGLIKLWDAASMHKKCTLKGQISPLHSMCYSPDGKQLATAGGEGTITFWDVVTGSKLGGFDWQIGQVENVAFSPDGMRAAAGGEGKVMIWDLDWDF